MFQETVSNCSDSLASLSRTNSTSSLPIIERYADENNLNINSDADKPEKTLNFVSQLGSNNVFVDNPTYHSTGTGNNAANEPIQSGGFGQPHYSTYKPHFVTPVVANTPKPSNLLDFISEELQKKTGENVKSKKRKKFTPQAPVQVKIDNDFPALPVNPKRQADKSIKDKDQPKPESIRGIADSLLNKCDSVRSGEDSWMSSGDLNLNSENILLVQNIPSSTEVDFKNLHDQISLYGSIENYKFVRKQDSNEAYFK